MTADKTQTDALKTWLERLGSTAPDMTESVLSQGWGVDWRETVLASLFDPAASTAARILTLHANDESNPRTHRRSQNADKNRVTTRDARLIFKKLFSTQVFAAPAEGCVTTRYTRKKHVKT